MKIDFISILEEVDPNAVLPAKPGSFPSWSKTTTTTPSPSTVLTVDPTTKDYNLQTISGLKNQYGDQITFIIKSISSGVRSAPGKPSTSQAIAGAHTAFDSSFGKFFDIK